MRVRVEKSNQKSFWYSKHIGEVFEVDPETAYFSEYRLTNAEVARLNKRNNEDALGYCINVSDAVILVDDGWKYFDRENLPSDILTWSPDEYDVQFQYRNKEWLTSECFSLHGVHEFLKLMHDKYRGKKRLKPNTPHDAAWKWIEKNGSIISVKNPRCFDGQEIHTKLYDAFIAGTKYKEHNDV